MTVLKEEIYDLTLSMTGYGQGIKTVGAYTVTIDLKSVNHRYLDLNFRISKNYGQLEDLIRRKLTQVISRGKVEITINVESYINDDFKIVVNHNVITAYLTATAELQEKYSIPGELNLTSLLTLPDIFKQTPADVDQVSLQQAAEGALDEAVGILLNMRRTEGCQLQKDLQQRLVNLEKLWDKIKVQAGTVVGLYQEKLLKRLGELTEGIDLDPNRIVMEVAIFADKSDINEELVRLKSHLEQFSNTLILSEPIGRKLDFLIQELNREINTIGSKANDLQIAQIVIEFKSELEKLREQIQNIE